jgi:hypothetical protein
MTDVEWLERPCIADLRGRALAGEVSSLLPTGARGFFLRALTGGGLTVHVAVPAGARRDGFRPSTRVPLNGSVFTGAGLASVTRDFLADATPVLLDVLDVDPDDRGALLAGAADLMIGHLPAVAGSSASGIQGDVPLSFLSFRSHAEAFLATCRDPAAARAALERRYQAVQQALRRKVCTVLADTGNEPPVSRGWHGVVASAKPAVADRFAAADLGTAAEPDGDQLFAADAFAANEFHGTLGRSEELLLFLRTDPGFLATRLLTSLLYLSLHDIGVSLVERYFLCYAVSRACESVFGVDAVTVLAGLGSS